MDLGEDAALRMSPQPQRFDQPLRGRRIVRYRVLRAAMPSPSRSSGNSIAPSMAITGSTA